MSANTHTHIKCRNIKRQIWSRQQLVSVSRKPQSHALEPPGYTTWRSQLQCHLRGPCTSCCLLPESQEPVPGASRFECVEASAQVLPACCLSCPTVSCVPPWCFPCLVLCPQETAFLHDISFFALWLLGWTLQEEVPAEQRMEGEEAIPSASSLPHSYPSSGVLHSLSPGSLSSRMPSSLSCALRTRRTDPSRNL